uniref:Uncharacterized protein n=1 Tax=viral metagenome TaxID=1070528 RepID=A0A6M3LE34_9ZZZZ
MKSECPICRTELESLLKIGDKSPYHYRCPKCERGFYVHDLKGVAGMRLSGKTDEYIRNIILKEEENVGKPE